MRITKAMWVYPLAVLMTACLSAGGAFAQKNEVGLMLGGLFTGERNIQSTQPGTAEIGTGLTYQVTYARRVVNGESTSLHVEVLFTATPSIDVKSADVTLPRNYASIFLVPGLKVKFFKGSRISPHVSAGGGYARFAESDFRIDDQPNTGRRGTNTGVFAFGGGVDFQVWRFLSLRGEVRDFISGNPNFNVALPGPRQHNVLTSGGIVLRF